MLKLLTSICYALLLSGQAFCQSMYTSADVDIHYKRKTLRTHNPGRWVKATSINFDCYYPFYLTRYGKIVVNKAIIPIKINTKIAIKLPLKLSFYITKFTHCEMQMFNNNVIRNVDDGRYLKFSIDTVINIDRRTRFLSFPFNPAIKLDTHATVYFNYTTPDSNIIKFIELQKRPKNDAFSTFYKVNNTLNRYHKLVEDWPTIDFEYYKLED